MKKEDKNSIIEAVTGRLNKGGHFYLTDTSGLSVEDTNKLRRLCFNQGIKMKVVKNTLLKKAMQASEHSSAYEPLHPALKGATAIMFTEVGNTPAKMIQELRKKNPKPTLKAAFIEECCYLGDNQLEVLANIKSKNELIGDVIGLLQSPAKNVISALKSSGDKLARIVKAVPGK